MRATYPTKCAYIEQNSGRVLAPAADATAMERSPAAFITASACRSSMERRNLNLKAKFESSLSHYSFKRSDPGGFNMVLIGSTCTALP